MFTRLVHSLLLCSEVQSVCISNVSFKEKSLKYFQFCASTINLVEKSKRAPRRPSNPTVKQWNGAIGSLSKELLRCTEKAEKSAETRKEINYTTNYTRRHFALNPKIDHSLRNTRTSPFNNIQHSRKLFFYRRWFHKHNSSTFFVLKECFLFSRFICDNNCESQNEASTPSLNQRQLQELLWLLRL
jgi:hypothetical protein